MHVRLILVCLSSDLNHVPPVLAATQEYQRACWPRHSEDGDHACLWDSQHLGVHTADAKEVCTRCCPQAKVQPVQATRRWRWVNSFRKQLSNSREVTFNTDRAGLFLGLCVCGSLPFWDHLNQEECESISSPFLWLATFLRGAGLEEDRRTDFS